MSLIRLSILVTLLCAGLVQCGPTPQPESIEEKTQSTRFVKPTCGEGEKTNPKWEEYNEKLKSQALKLTEELSIPSEIEDALGSVKKEELPEMPLGKFKDEDTAVENRALLGMLLDIYQKKDTYDFATVAEETHYSKFEACIDCHKSDTTEAVTLKFDDLESLYTADKANDLAQVMFSIQAQIKSVEEESTETDSETATATDSDTSTETTSETGTETSTDTDISTETNEDSENKQEDEAAARPERCIPEEETNTESNSEEKDPETDNAENPSAPSPE